MPRVVRFEDEVAGDTPESLPPSMPSLVDIELGNYTHEQKTTLVLAQILKNEEYAHLTLFEIYTLKVMMIAVLFVAIVLTGFVVYFGISGTP